MTENATATVETPVEASATPAVKSKDEPKACECSLFTVLTNVRDDAESGDILYDDELSTGCSATTNSIFAPGHDATLKSFLIGAAFEDGDVRRRDGALSVSDDSMGWAAKYGFTAQVKAGIERKRAKLEARSARLAKAQEAKEAREADKEAKKVAREQLAASKAAAKAKEAAEKAAAKLAAASEPLQPVVEASEPLPNVSPEFVLAAVGSGEYLGTVSDSPEYGPRFTYEDSEGVSQTTTEFTLSASE